MYWTLGFKRAAAVLVLGIACVAESSVYNDPDTGLTFSQHEAEYSLQDNIAFRVAVPAGAPANTPYDAVLQVFAPIDVGWTGLAWGGQMTGNPLCILWADGNDIVVSSRYTNTRVLPQVYNDATYEVMPAGTYVTGTHWQFTARCTGCTSFVDGSGNDVILDPSGSNRFAFAFSETGPSNPSDPTSDFPGHSVFSIWTHDFSEGANDDFDALVMASL